MAGIDAVDEVSLLTQASDATVSHGRRRYAAMVSAGRIVEPRLGRPLGRSGAALLGGVILSPAERIGDRHLVPAWLVRDEGVHALTPRFPTAEAAARFRASVALRAGGALGKAQDTEAAAVLEAHLMREARAWIVPSVGNDRVAKILLAWTLGFDLALAQFDEGGPGFGDMLSCADGYAWQRVLNRAGAADVSMECRNAVFSEFDWEVAGSPADAPASAWYVLRDREGRIATTVRVPPDAGSTPPEIESRHGRDPFASDGRHVSMLSAHLGIVLSPAHVRNEIIAGRWDTRTAKPLP